MIMDDMTDILVQLGQINTNLANLESKVNDLDHDLSEYVTKVQFTPVERIAYGLVALLLSGVIIAILGVVLAGGGVAV